MYDWKNADGEKTPVLIQTSKTGNIFAPGPSYRQTCYREVEERPVPTSPAAEGEHLSPTQPLIGMPTIGVEPLTEKSMWGRDDFRSTVLPDHVQGLRLRGPVYTSRPRNRTSNGQGLLGGMNWGHFRIDENTGMMLLTTCVCPCECRW